MSDKKPDKRELDPHPEQRSAKAPRLRDRSQDTPGPSFASASSSDFLDAPESLHSITENRGPAPQAATAAVPDQTGTRGFRIELSSSPPGAPVQIETTTPASLGYVPALHMPAHLIGRPISSALQTRAVTYHVEAYSSLQPFRRVQAPRGFGARTLQALVKKAPAQHPKIPIAQTLQFLAQTPPVPVQAPRFEAQALDCQRQILNSQAQPPIVTRRTLGPRGRLCKCTCTRKDTCALHNCCMFGVLLTKVERWALANAANPQLRVKAIENSFRTTAWKPQVADDIARTPPLHAGSTANAAPFTARDSARTSFPPADENQRHVPGIRRPPPVPQHPAIPNVAQAAHTHSSNPVLDMEAMETLMNQVRDGFATLQAMPSSTHSAKAIEAVIASLQGDFQIFVITIVQQRDLDWQTAMNEHNKRVQSERSDWHASLKKMDAESQTVVNERERRITDLERQIGKLKIGTADPRNQPLGFHQEHLAEYTRLTKNGILGDTPASMTKDILRSRGLLPPYQENRRATVHQGNRLPQANRQPALPRPHYISTAESNARMAAMYPDLESHDGEDNDEDEGINVQTRSENSAAPSNVVSPMEKGENMEVDSD